MNRKTISFIFLGLFVFLFIAGFTSGAVKIVPADPSVLIIPSIGVKANVVEVGLTKEGNMGISDDGRVVAWYRYGKRPGEVGSAVINGHVDTKELKQAVFYDLDKLKKGDIIEVVDKNSVTFKFKVVAKKIYDFDDSSAEVFASSSVPMLNLITCAGEWIPSQKIYDKRIVVFSQLME